MKIREVASQFSVFVFWTDIDRGAGLKVALAQAGYDAFFFQDQEVLMNRLQEKPPHLLVFPTGSVTGNLSDFVEKALAINSEIRFIVLAKPSQFETLAAYNQYGLVDLLENQREGLEARTVFAVDRACEKLYLQYQNEYLVEQTQSLHEAAAQTQAAQQENEQKIQRMGPPLDVRIKDYLTAESKEELLRRWILALGETPCVYLTYLPTVHSLAAIFSTVMDPVQLQSMTCLLTPAEAKDFEKQISVGFVPPSLQNFLVATFQMSHPRLLPVFVRGKLEGIAAFSSGLPISQKDRLQDEFSLMSLAYAHLSLEKRLDLLEVVDPVTEVYNRKFYESRLQEEWARARRSKRPLAVMKLALDDFFELEQTLGESTRDQLLKNLAQVILKTGRTNDVVCRSGANEFSVIMTHFTKQGTTLRAERLRRIIEGSQMLENGLKISVSIGISEYPSLCSSSASLDETATKALGYILDKGGNRLCLYKAPPDHKPEFEVPAEPVT